MFLKIKPLIFSLIFLMGLEAIFVFYEFYWLISIATVILSVYAGKKIGGRWSFAFLPSIFTASSLALFNLVTLPLEKQLFIALSFLMYYIAVLGIFRLGKYREDQTARGMIASASFSAAFFSFAASYGIYLNFLIPVYFLMTAYFIITLLLSYQSLIFFGKDKKKVWVFSFVLAFLLAEIVWALNYWPFGYLTTGVSALILYYVLWEIVRSYFALSLTKKRMVIHMATLSVLAALVLLTSKWTPAF